MQLGKVDGFAPIGLGAMLFGLQAMIYVTPKQVVNDPPAFSTRKVAHETYPVPGILGVACLPAGLAVLAASRRADEPEAENAVK